MHEALSAPSPGRAEARRLWGLALERLTPHLPARQLETWIKPLEPLGLDGRRVLVGCPSPFLRDWVRDHYLADIERALEPATEGPRQLELVLEPPTTAATSGASPAASEPLPELTGDGAAHGNGTGSTDGVADAARPLHPAVARVRAPADAAPARRPALPPVARDLTFDRLVVGPHNRLAEAAARSLLERAGGAAAGATHNPLFLNAGVGLGKTHIACAVVNAALAGTDGPPLTVRFVPAERFVAELVAAIPSGELAAFQERYRRAQLLVIDDVEFLGGKRRTQLDFAQALDSLVQAGRQVVLTGNGDPSVIPDLIEPLRSRLQGGLVVDIERPDLETRAIIVEQRARELGAPLAARVVELVASAATSNVRDLIGALHRVIAFASFNGVAPDVAVATRALRPYLAETRRPLGLEELLERVAAVHGLSADDLRGPSRKRTVALPRQVTLYLGRKHTRASLAGFLGRLVGRTHSSVINALASFEKALARDPALVRKVRFLEEELGRGGPRVTEARRHLEVAVEVAHEAGRLALDGLGHAGRIDLKSGPTNLVTDVDRAAERLIVERLTAAFPDLGVLGEEGQADREGAGGRWIVDPLDGTTNFAHGHPMFAVSIALEVDGEVVCGVVHHPVLGETFAAVAGGGATLDGRPLRVSRVETMSRALLGTGFPYDLKEHPERPLATFGRAVLAVQGIRRCGSAALDLCYVAAGRLDGFYEMGLAPWDIAAGALIVREAGGRTTDFAGRPLHDLGCREMVATNGLLHDELLAIVTPGAP